MIAKELDVNFKTDSLSKSGFEAEKQIAFYLKQKFYKDNDVLVFNNLRFKRLDTYTQIDHLIATQYGLIIIESKSVTSKVKYNKCEEWHRLWDNHWVGMENPVQQAKRQGDSIKDILRDNCALIRGKLLGLMQKGFGEMPVDSIVAISNSCNEIRRDDDGADLYKGIVIKADLVTDRILEIQGKYKKADSLFAKETPPWKMSLDELMKLKDFLLSIHVPAENPPPKPVKTQEVITQKAAVPETKPPVKEEKIESLKCCPECGGKVSILWGAKYKNYYWHCNACGKNIGINYKCPTCQDKLWVKKQGNEYHIYCDPCKLSALYFTDKEEAK